MRSLVVSSFAHELRRNFHPPGCRAPRRSWSSIGWRRRGCRAQSSLHNCTMGVPFEALLPYGICLAVRFSLSTPTPTPSLTPIPSVLRYHRRRPLQDQKHAERRKARQTLHRPVGQTKCAYIHRPRPETLTPRTVMDRDRRLTGWLRGQVDRPIAPAGFEYSNGWRVRQFLLLTSSPLSTRLTPPPGREELALDASIHPLAPYIFPLAYLDLFMLSEYHFSCFTTFPLRHVFERKKP